MTVLNSFIQSGLAATFAEELKYLFAEMGIATAICLGLGLIFIIIEIFMSGFGFFGITGILLIIAGMVLRVTDGGNGNPLLQLLLMILILAIICIIAFVIMAYSAKKGWLSRTPFVMKENAVSTGITEGTEDYSLLIGMQGKSISMLRPSGIAEINGKRYDVIALGVFIEPDKNIVVDSVEGVRIVVKEIQ